MLSCPRFSFLIVLLSFSLPSPPWLGPEHCILFLLIIQSFYGCILLTALTMEETVYVSFSLGAHSARKESKLLHSISFLLPLETKSRWYWFSSLYFPIFTPLLYIDAVTRRWERGEFMERGVKRKKKRNMNGYIVIKS